MAVSRRPRPEPKPITENINGNNSKAFIAKSDKLKISLLIKRFSPGQQLDAQMLAQFAYQLGKKYGEDKSMDTFFKILKGELTEANR